MVISMQVNSGEIIKNIRTDMGLTQGEMASRMLIDQKKISRIESGSAKIDIWELMQLLELLGFPSEDFWLLYLDSEEYKGYRTYRLLKKQLWNKELDKAEVTISSIKQNPLVNKPFIVQFLKLADVIMDESMSHEDAIEKLFDIIRISVPKFEISKISEYRLIYNEIYVLIEMAGNYSKMGDNDTAIKITKAVIESRENSRTSEEDRARLFPALLFNLSNYLGQSGRTREALKACSQAIEICIEYSNLEAVPQILLNMASCHFIMGEQEHMYKTYLIRAYHTAFAHGNLELGNRIRKNAELEFGIKITDL